MRRFAAILMTMGLLALSTPAWAGTTEFVNGANGVLTCGFDVVRGAIEGKQVVDLGPANIVTDRIGGAVDGARVAALRLGTGVYDMLTALFTDQVGGAKSPPAFVNVLSLASE